MKLLKWCYDHRIILLIDILCLCAGLICLFVSGSISKKAYDQQEGSRWATGGDTPYHQVSASFPASQSLSRQSISGVRAQMQRSINDASLSDEGRGRPWADAYAAFATGDVTKVTSLGMAGVENVMIIGVSEDFFLFHPMDVISGSVLPQDMVNDDLILIDRETAWNLYGSNDIAGQKVYINGSPFVISGVYDPDSSKMSKKAMQQKCIMISYAAFEKLYADTPITCYEAVIPNPVNSFAINCLQDATGGENSGVILVDNEARFSTKALLSRFSDIHLLLMETSDVIFPFWENRIRGIEWDLFILLILRLIFFLPPLVSVIFVLVSFIRNRGRKMWQKFLADLKERIRRRLWERPVKKKVGIEDEDF